MNSHHHDQVRAIHDEFASSTDPGLATVRPQGTTASDLLRIATSISSRLELDESKSLLDVGCGNGMLAMHYLEKSSHYTGLDYSTESLNEFRRRVTQRGFEHRVSLLGADIAENFDSDIKFDRILAYASFHYAPDDMEAKQNLRILVNALNVNGVLLIGSLPLDDLARVIDNLRVGNAPVRILKVMAWLTRTDLAIATPLWKFICFTHLASRKVKRLVRPVTHSSDMPLNSDVVSLTTTKLLGWLTDINPELSVRFVAPCARAPLALGRADLVITRVN